MRFHKRQLNVIECGTNSAAHTLYKQRVQGVQGVQRDVRTPKSHLRKEGYSSFIDTRKEASRMRSQGRPQGNVRRSMAHSSKFSMGKVSASTNEDKVEFIFNNDQISLCKKEKIYLLSSEQRDWLADLHKTNMQIALSKKELIQIDRFKFKISKIKELDYTISGVQVYKSDFSPIDRIENPVSLLQTTVKLPISAFSDEKVI